MKQRALALAIKRMLWAELALSAAMAAPAFAQSQPATTGNTAATTTSEATPTATDSGNVTKMQRVEVTGSLIRTSDKVGNTEVQTITPKEIEQSGYTTVADFLRGTSAKIGRAHV